MGYIGKIPSAVPLTSADITDNVITSAKIVDGTITNTDIASSIITGQTAETSIAGGDSILIYDDSATALRKMTRTNFVSGLGGLTEADSFRLNASINFASSGTSTVTSNWERVDTDSFDKIGTGLSQSSGIFSFPSTGFYLIKFNGTFSATQATLYVGFFLEVTTNNSTYSATSAGYSSCYALNSYTGNSNSFIIKVTDTANIKFRFSVDRAGTVDLIGDTGSNYSSFTCIKLGEI